MQNLDMSGHTPVTGLMGGWAFRADRDEMLCALRARYDFLQRFYKGTTVSRVEGGYAHFIADVQFPEGADVSNEDALLMADGGNACFGGAIQSRSGTRFRVKVYTD